MDPTSSCNNGELQQRLACPCKLAHLFLQSTTFLPVFAFVEPRLLACLPLTIGLPPVVYHINEGIPTKDPNAISICSHLSFPQTDL